MENIILPRFLSPESTSSRAINQNILKLLRHFLPQVMKIAYFFKTKPTKISLAHGTDLNQ